MDAASQAKSHAHFMDLVDITTSMPDVRPVADTSRSEINDVQRIETAADKENVDLSLSDQNLIEAPFIKLPLYKHVRSGSDPPFGPDNQQKYRKLRLSVCILLLIHMLSNHFLLETFFNVIPLVKHHS